VPKTRALARELRIVTDNGVTHGGDLRDRIACVPEFVAEAKHSTGQARSWLYQSGQRPGRPWGQRDWFAFDVKQGERITCNLKGFRLNGPRGVLQPALYLSDATKTWSRNGRGRRSRIGTDPVLEWTAACRRHYTLWSVKLLYPAILPRLRLAIGSGTTLDGRFATAVFARPRCHGH